MHGCAGSPMSRGGADAIPSEPPPPAPTNTHAAISPPLPGAALPSVPRPGKRGGTHTDPAPPTLGINPSPARARDRPFPVETGGTCRDGKAPAGFRRGGAVCLQAWGCTRLCFLLARVCARLRGGVGGLAQPSRSGCMPSTHPAHPGWMRPRWKPPRSNYRPGSNYLLPASGWPWPAPRAAGTLAPCAGERCVAAGPAPRPRHGRDAVGPRWGRRRWPRWQGCWGSRWQGATALASQAKPAQDPRSQFQDPSPQLPRPRCWQGAGGPAPRGFTGAESGPPQTPQPPSASGPALAGWKVRLSAQPGSPPPPCPAGTAVSQGQPGDTAVRGGRGGRGALAGGCGGGAVAARGGGSHCPPLTVGSPSAWGVPEGSMGGGPGAALGDLGGMGGSWAAQGLLSHL